MTQLVERTRAQLRPYAERVLATRSLATYCRLMRPRYESARHLVALNAHLEALERGEIQKLAVCMPPRHGKSETAARLFVAWYLGRNPSAQIVLASYGAELAEGHSRAVREQLNDERYPFDVRVSPESSAVNRWATTAGGQLIAVGVGSGLTGYGADLLLIDDAVRDREAAESEPIRASTLTWYQDVARTRLMPNAAQIVIGTRWHESDLIGELLSPPGGREWTSLIFPAIAEVDDPLGREFGEALWPERFPISELPCVERGEISTRSFEALYQQRPAPAVGLLFKVEWFGRYTELPQWAVVPEPAVQRSEFERALIFGDTKPRIPVTRVMAVDCASKTGVSNDFSALVMLTNDRRNTYVVDVVRERLEFADLARRIVGFAERHEPDYVFIEEASSGIPIVQELKRLTRLPIIGVPPKGSKIARAEAVTAMVEAGRVLLPERAPWLEAYLDEFRSFPVGRNDDMCDATVLGLSMIDAIVAKQISTERIYEQLSGGFIGR